MLDDHVDLLEHIDALHDRRLRSASPRERHAATRVLAEALHRIVDGYDVEIEPPNGRSWSPSGRTSGWAGCWAGPRSAGAAPRAA